MFVIGSILNNLQRKILIQLQFLNHFPYFQTVVPPLSGYPRFVQDISSYFSYFNTGGAARLTLRSQKKGSSALERAACIVPSSSSVMHLNESN
jgi:hypothetical protein